MWRRIKAKLLDIWIWCKKNWVILVSLTGVGFVALLLISRSNFKWEKIALEADKEGEEANRDGITKEIKKNNEGLESINRDLAAIDKQIEKNKQPVKVKDLSLEEIDKKIREHING